MGTEMLSHIQKITMVIQEAKTDQGNIYLGSELVMFQSSSIIEIYYNLSTTLEILISL